MKKLLASLRPSSKKVTPPQRATSTQDKDKNKKSQNPSSSKGDRSSASKTTKKVKTVKNAHLQRKLSRKES